MTNIIKDYNMETTITKGKLVKDSIHLHRKKQEKGLDSFYNRLQEFVKEKDQLLSDLKEFVSTEEYRKEGCSSLMMEGRDLVDECEEIKELSDFVEFWKKEVRVKDTNHLLNQVNEVMNHVWLEDRNRRLKISRSELTVPFLIQDFKKSILRWEREVDRDYENYDFIQFCYQLIDDIEFGRGIEMMDRFGNRYDFVGHLKLKNRWGQTEDELHINYTIPKMELEWLNKVYQFFQDRIDFWEELDPEEDDLNMFYPLQFDDKEDMEDVSDNIIRFYEQLRNSTKIEINRLDSSLD